MNSLTVIDPGTVTGSGVMIWLARMPRSRPARTACWASAVAAPVRNQPVSEIHSQLQSRVRKKRYRPPTMQIVPKTWPARLAHTVAFTRSPVRHQMTPGMLARAGWPVPTSRASPTKTTPNSHSVMLFTVSS